MLDYWNNYHVVGVLNPIPDAGRAGQVGAELAGLLDQVMPFVTRRRRAEIGAQFRFAVEDRRWMMMM
jgi:hypothetical protein